MKTYLEFLNESSKLVKQIQDKIQHERDKGMDYPPSQKLLNLLDEIETWKTKKKIFDNTAEWYDILINDRNRYDKSYNEIYRQIEKMLFNKRKEYRTPYDTSKLKKILEEIKKYEGDDYEELYSHIEEILYIIENNEMVGLKEYSDFNTLKQAINAIMKTVKRLIKKEFMNETILETLEGILKEMNI